ncbi:CsbD family protein [Sphingomonas sp. Tas61C01]|uniref:CsbD family protein n=1 Tax=Sphingomonas sp. Tas61C01 TaxID=3458297 RepID=UPI00403E9BCC
MNQDEIEGGVRYVKGKIEKNVGDVASSASWQADGIVNQVAGGAQNLYGRAKDHVEDLIDDAPGMLQEAGDRARHVASRGRDVANEQMKQNPWALAAVVGVVGYAISWLIHGKRI